MSLTLNDKYVNKQETRIGLVGIIYGGAQKAVREGARVLVVINSRSQHCTP